MGALAIVLEVIGAAVKLAPQAIATWNDLKPFATSLYTQINGAAPTPEQQAELEAQIDALYLRSQEPLPPAQLGDPDFVEKP